VPPAPAPAEPAAALAVVPSAAPPLADVLNLLTDSAAATTAAQANPSDFAWQLFVAVNWPAKAGSRGAPDPSKQPGAADDVVWRTWKAKSEVFLAGGAAPAAWSAPDPQQPPVLETQMIDGTTLLDVKGNQVAYEVRLNQGIFDYIVRRSLYSYPGQAALLQATAPAATYPASAMEVKASWRILNADDDAKRYITAQAVFPGGTTLTAALTGLHVTSRALPDWVWTTFEHVDNEKTTQAKYALPIDAAAAAANTKWQAALAGTPLANYRLNGAQTTFVDAQGKPTLLASSQMETAFQTSSSCITCHALSGVGDTLPPRPNIWQVVGGFQGIVGEVPANVFAPNGPYRSLNSAWALQNAKSPN
jgi:hypothetical protein